MSWKQCTLQVGVAGVARVGEEVSHTAGGSFRKDGGDQGKPLLLAVDVPQEKLSFGYAEPGRRAGCPQVRKLEVPCDPVGADVRLAVGCCSPLRLMMMEEKCTSAKNQRTPPSRTIRSLPNRSLWITHVSINVRKYSTYTGVWLSSSSEEKNDVCRLCATKSLVGITSELTIFQYLLADLHVNWLAD